MRKLALLTFGLFLITATSLSLDAVEPAPRISDREIIEALVELKAGQKALNQRFEQVDKRFEQLDKRFGQIIALFIGIAAAFAAIVASTIGFAIWDRRTTLKPALERSDALSVREEKVERVLTEYARIEPRLAKILQSVGMF